MAEEGEPTSMAESSLLESDVPKADSNTFD